MVAQTQDRRTGRLAGAVGIALLLAGLTLLLEPAPRRGAAAVLLAVGLAVGVVVARRRPPSGRARTPMERLNDAAFLVVVAAVALVAVRLARPWTAALPGLVGGTLVGLTLRPVPGPTAPGEPGPGEPGPGPAGPGEAGPGPAGPGEAGPDRGQARTPPPDPGQPGTPPPNPGQAGTPPPDAGPPGGGR